VVGVEELTGEGAVGGVSEQQSAGGELMVAAVGPGNSRSDPVMVRHPTAWHGRRNRVGTGSMTCGE
jgi:hypothetical protein